MKKASENVYLIEYIDKMTETMKGIHPNWDEDKIRENISKVVNKRVQNIPVTIWNDYTGDSKETSLLSVFAWAKERKPLIAGNGTFYVSQEELLSPAAVMLDGFLTDRKKLKAQMFAMDDVYSYQYELLDLMQGNKKRGANSYYGAGGAMMSRFYSVINAPATTLTAQSIISTTEQLFESFLADNYKYLDITELIDWIHYIESEYDAAISKDSFDIIDSLYMPSKEEIFDRLYSKIIDKQYNDDEILKNLIRHKDSKFLKFLFYKNNLLSFIYLNPLISDILIEIVNNVPYYSVINSDDENWKDKIEFSGDYNSIKEYNSSIYSEMFFNPNKPPKSIERFLKVFLDYVMTFVYSSYISFDKIYRLRNFKRKTVTVIDTDSNILILDNHLKFINDNILAGKVIDRPEMFNRVLIVNILAYLITGAVNDILITYARRSNISDTWGKKFTMKNEFLMMKLLIGDAKKRYISQILLREGTMLNPPKLDVKGFDFKKATTSSFMEKACNKAISKYLLQDELDIDGLTRYVYQLKQEVIQSIRDGNTDTLPRGNAKELQSYKDPSTQQQIRGSLAWNAVYPDNPIEFPAKVSLLKLTSFTEESILPLKENYPDVYDRLYKTVFLDETGIFNTERYVIKRVERLPYTLGQNWIDEIPDKYKKTWKDKSLKEWNDWVDKYDGKDKYLPEKGEMEFKKRGLQVLAIPDGEKIPEWCQPLIDMSTVVNTIMSPVSAITRMFKNRTIPEGKSYKGINRKTNGFSNIIKL